MNRETGNIHFSDILQYNITADTIEKVSELSFPMSGGLALNSKDSKYIYHFGGSNMKTAIHRFNRATKATIRLNTVLPSDVVEAAGVTTPYSAFIFDGREGNIMEFDTTSEILRKIGNLSFGNITVFSTASITDSASNRVWLFPASWNKPTNRVKIFNLVTRLTSNPRQNVSVPSLYKFPATESAGRYGYIIGELGSEAESDGTKHPSRGILR
jgi:hypothetical protein